MVALLRSRGETLKRLGSEWEWKFHDERVTIRGHLWFDQYTQKGGDAVDFFHYFYGESEEQAAAMLLNCSVQDLEKLPARSPPVSSRPKQEEPKQLEIPSVNGHMRRVFAYLCQTRGIAPEVVSAFARKGLLYESADHHNAVFVGRDEQGEIRHLHARGTLTGSHFRQTLPGSEKEYSFHWPGTSGKLYAFEAPIDLLSYISLHPEGWQDHSYVALCGVSAAPSTTYWKRNPSCRTSPCAWTMTKLDTTLPAGSPANCCGNGTSLCPLNSPRSRIGMTNCSPTTKRKARV